MGNAARKLVMPLVQPTKKRKRRTEIQAFAREVGTNQARVLAKAVFHLDSDSPEHQSGQLPKAEAKKTICTQSKEEMHVTVDDPPCANAPLGAIAAATRTTINDHAFLSDMMNEIWEKGMCRRDKYDYW